MSNIAFDASSTGVAVSGSTLTYAHTCTGNNRYLFVNCRVTGVVDIFTSITYAGVTMTRIAAVANATLDTYFVLYGLVTPATGANNIVITLNTVAAKRSTGSSYTGANPVDQPDASTTATQASSSSVTKSLTTVAPNCWVICATDNDINVATNGTNYVNRNNSAGVGIGDSNIAVPTGALSQTVNTSGTANWSVIQASIAPIPEGGAALFAAA